jgi:hypothetical protein
VYGVEGSVVVTFAACVLFLEAGSQGEVIEYSTSVVEQRELGPLRRRRSRMI